jgi:tetratricopeptide (TPR) repeat protein
MLQAEAVMALISARSESGDRGPELDRLCGWLEELGAEVESSYSRGLISWTLGIAAFRRKEVDKGVAALESALKSISPQRDLRTWARLHKAIANNRVDAGFTDGVSESLSQARQGLQLVGNPSDLLELHLLEAKIAYSEGDLRLAELLIRHCLDDEVLQRTDHLAGEAERLRGHVAQAQGKLDEARAAFAASATHLEAAGAFRLASESWHLHAQV